MTIISAGKKGHYFEGAAEIPGILKCLDKTLNEMSMAGLESESVDPGAFIIPGKGKELVWLIEAYERYLRENNLIDTPALLRTAMKKLQQGNIPENQRIVMVLSDFPLAQLEKDLISLAGRGKIVAVDHDRPIGFDAPARLFAT